MRNYSALRFMKKAQIQRPVILAILIPLAIISSLYFSLTVTDGDESRYLLLAKAVAEGHGQSEIHLPEPKLEGLTPLGYPAVLSVCFKISTDPILACRVVSWLAYLAYGLFTILLLSKLDHRAPKHLIALTLCALLPVQALIYSWAIFAETCYLLLSMLALWCMLRGDKPLRGGLCTGLAVGAAMAFRPVGLALIPAIGLHYIWRKQWTAAFACGAGFMVAYAPVVVFSYKALGVPFGYLSHYGAEASLLTKLQTVFHTLSIILPHYLFEAMPRMMFFSLMDGDNLLAMLHLGALVKVVGIIIALLIVLGFILRIKDLKAFDLYALVYAPMVSTYEVALYRGIESRYLLPLLPHAFLYVFTALQFLSSKVKASPRIPTIALIAMLAYVTLTAVGAGLLRLKAEWPLRGYDAYAAARHLNHPDPSRQAFGRYIESAEWIKENTPESAFIVSRKPRHTFLINGRTGFRLAEVREENEKPIDTLDRVAEDQLLYVLQDAYPPDSKYGQDRAQSIDPMLDTHANRFELVFETESPVTRVWKRLK